MSRPHDDPAWLEVGRLAELGLLSAALVHELRQPLFALKALLQIQARDPEGDSARGILEAALAQVDRIEWILATQGGLAERPGDWTVPFAVEQPLGAALATLEARARRQGVACTLAVEPDLPVIHGNPSTLQQAVVNLLQNALDALEGSASGCVRITATAAPGEVVIRVEDDGPAIPPETLAHVFDLWFTTKPPGKGTGLGLAIVRHLVEAAGGRIEVASRLGSTTFVIHHPVQPVPP